MKKFYLYAFVFRYHDFDAPVSYEIRILSFKDARKHYKELSNEYDYVFMFKQCD